MPQYLLARRAGWPIGHEVSGLFNNADAVAATPLVVKRLSKLAVLVGFDGPVFLDEPEAA
jgi:hypothetical protein